VPQIRSLDVTSLVLYKSTLMGSHHESLNDDVLIANAQAGDRAAAARLFDRHRGRLRKMMEVRLDRRLQSRVDPSDIVQEVYIEMARSIPQYQPQPQVPFYFWLRALACGKLSSIHRQHLGTQKRMPQLEVPLHRGALPHASSASLAQQILGTTTSPTQFAQRAELQVKLQDALNEMDPLDREILVLRHFEELANTEIAKLLGIEKAAASKRYLRALRRLREVLSGINGLFGE
jgi:RNA polymerase sigma-70 factor, ECF subfamily